MPDRRGLAVGAEWRRRCEECGGHEYGGAPACGRCRELVDGIVEEEWRRFLRDAGFEADQDANQDTAQAVAVAEMVAEGLLHNSSRAVWSLTDAGHTVTEQEIPSLRHSYDERRRKERRRKRREQVDRGQLDTSAESDAWRDQLLETLLRTPPHAFERLAQRLLREAGFTRVTVTGRTSDGGIDAASEPPRYVTSGGRWLGGATRVC